MGDNEYSEQGIIERERESERARERASVCVRASVWTGIVRRRKSETERGRVRESEASREGETE